MPRRSLAELFRAISDLLVPELIIMLSKRCRSCFNVSFFPSGCDCAGTGNGGGGGGDKGADRGRGGGGGGSLICFGAGHIASSSSSALAISSRPPISTSACSRFSNRLSILSACDSSPAWRKRSIKSLASFRNASSTIEAWRIFSTIRLYEKFKG